MIGESDIVEYNAPLWRVGRPRHRSRTSAGARYVWIVPGDSSRDRGEKHEP